MKHDFEERREKCITNAQNRAIKNRKAAVRLFNSAKKMAGAIPFGQPILVGHHSEKRDRNYRNKIHNTFGKSFEAQDKADYYEDKAESIASNTAIFTDDPNALQKLTDKLIGLKTIQVFMKAANKCIRNDDKEAFMKLELATETLWQQLNTPVAPYGKGFQQFKLTNNNANIRRIEGRIDQLKRQEQKQAVDKTINGVRIFENRESNRLQIIFEGKPADEIRKQLKANGFRWSPGQGAWQRHICHHAVYTAERILNALKD